MARLEIGHRELLVRLSSLEKLLALRADIHIPMEQVKLVRVSERPTGELRGFRMPGFGIPGVLAVGVRRGHHQRDFEAIYSKKPAVVIDLEGGPFDQVVISCEDAKSCAADLAKLLLSRNHLPRQSSPPPVL